MSSQLLINEPPLQVLPSLAQKVGLNEAIILQQVHYWLNPQFNKMFFNGRHWVHNTITQWQHQFPFWATNTIRRAVANLEESGLLSSFVTRDFKKLKYFSIDYRNLEQLAIDSKTNYQKFPENQPFHPSTQNRQIDLWKPTHRDTQNGQIEIPKMGSPYINSDSENTIHENTLPPPLTPPPQISTRKKEEDEEEIYFEYEKVNGNPDQDQNQIKDEAGAKEEEVKHQNAQEDGLFSEMITIWNQTVQEKLNAGQAVQLTSKRKSLLNQLLQEVFPCTTKTEKIDLWQGYCLLISKSRFLTGQNPSGFKVTLEWALVPDNARKVLEGAIYDKPGITNPQPNELSWEEFSQELVRTLPSSKCLTQWVKISINLAKLIGQSKYRSWFSNVILRELTSTKASFCVEGDFTKQYIVTHFSTEIRSAVQSSYPTVDQIEFQAVSPLGGAA